MPQIRDLQAIRIKLEKDRPWAAYALADLEPGHFERTSWFTHANGSGLTLLYDGYSKPILFCIEETADLGSVLDEIESAFSVRSFPCDIVIRPEYLPLIRARHRGAQERPMIRMALDARQYQPAPMRNTLRLGPDHFNDIRRLFGEEPPDFLSEEMVQEGVYFGAFEGTDLVALAGTHIVSSRYGVAAIGNIYTRPDRRRRGYCGRGTSAVVSELLRTRITTIVLNVREDNAAAIRVYERIGFRSYCRYLEIVSGG